MTRKSANNPMVGAVRVCLLSVSLFVLLVANCSGSVGGQTGGSSSQDSTGEPVARIKGSLARPGDYPFHVGVYIRNKYACGAALIDDKRILTSSRCVTKHNNGLVPLNVKDVTVKLGDYDISKLGDGESTLRLARMAVDQKSKLALLFANSSIGLNSIIGKGAIRTITLPANESTPTPNSSLFTGWAAHPLAGLLFPAPLKVQEVRSLKQCNNNPDFICAPQSAARRGPCKGDVGGPLFQVTNSSAFILFGIFQGSSCNTCNDPRCDNQFTNIPRALQWISDN